MLHRQTRSALFALAVILTGCGVNPGAPGAMQNLAGAALDAAGKASGGVKVVDTDFGKITLGLLPESGNAKSMAADDSELPTFDGENLMPGFNAMAAAPKKIDLRAYASPIRNQGNLGSCTAFAGTAVMEMGLNVKGAKAAGKKVKYLSPLFFYYAERKQMEETGDTPHATKKDTGANSTLAMKTAVSLGCVPEEMVPYKDGRAALAYDATPEQYEAAKAFKFTKKTRIQTIQGLKKALASKHAVAFGIAVYPSFMTKAVAQSGVMPMPGKDEQPEGGHALCMVGYDDEKQAFLVRNSWGTGWGDKGYFWMPYEFMKPQYVGPRYFNCWTIE